MTTAPAVVRRVRSLSTATASTSPGRACNALAFAVRRAPRCARAAPDLRTPISEPWRLREHVPCRKICRDAVRGAGRALLARSGSRQLAHRSLASCLTSPALGTTPQTAILRRSASAPYNFSTTLRNPAPGSPGTLRVPCRESPPGTRHPAVSPAPTTTGISPAPWNLASRPHRADSRPKDVSQARVRRFVVR